MPKWKDRSRLPVGQVQFPAQIQFCESQGPRPWMEKVSSCPGAHCFRKRPLEATLDQWRAEQSWKERTQVLRMAALRREHSPQVRARSAQPGDRCVRVPTPPALTGPSRPHRAAARALQGSRAGAGSDRRRGGAGAREPATAAQLAAGLLAASSRLLSASRPLRSRSLRRCSLLRGFRSGREALSLGSLRRSPWKRWAAAGRKGSGRRVLQHWCVQEHGTRHGRREGRVGQWRRTRVGHLASREKETEAHHVAVNSPEWTQFWVKFTHVAMYGATFFQC